MAKGAQNHAYKVLVADQLSEDGIKLLKDEPALSVDIKTGLSTQELAGIIGLYDALLVRSSTKVTAEVIEKAQRLKVIGRAGVGLDNVDAAAATKRGIVVMNVPAGNTISTAEQTFSLILALARRIPQADASLRAGKWERSKFVGTELFGKTLGVVGLGKIGTEVAKRAQAFGMRILACDPFVSKERAAQLEFELTDLKTLYGGADFITVHTPLTNETRHMVGAKEIALMKPGVRLINCARGGIIDEQALYDALVSGKVAGAALDVYEEEPPKAHPLFKLEQVVCTPHLGASTQEAQLNVAIEVAKQVADALLGRGIRNAVNMPSVDAQTLKVLQPYIVLGERLGSLASQLAGQIGEIRVTYVGEMTAHDTSAVTLAVLKGVLQPVVGENVNYVNASLIAAERGIQVIESKASQMDEFANLLAVDVRGNGSQLSVRGTLSPRREPRIVKIDRYFVEALPEGYMLIIRNQDKPGLIGALGTLLGEAKINIAGMSNGRDEPGGTAVTVVNIDNAVPPKVLEQVKKLKHVLDAKLIQL
ncbi:MAG: phosphoglycerate dehydrogenase [Candidatus Omnitrophica bacterium]|nr:phosphoglycerate dehydrogenase [Candidatus Omnitrophota bacterium]